MPHGRSIRRARQERPQALRARSASNAISGRSTIPCSTPNFRTRVSGPRSRWETIGNDKCPERGPEERQRHGHRSRSGQCAGDADGSGPGLSRSRSARRISMPGGAAICRLSLRPTCHTRSALMVLVDIVSRKAMDDAKIDPKVQQAWWGKRKNCPNPGPQPAEKNEPGPGIARARSTASGPPRLTCTTDRCPRSTGC